MAGVDRLLTRAHDLFPAGGEGGQVPTSGGGSVPAAPDGGSGLQGGVSRAAGSYQQAQTGAAGLDEELQQAAARGGAIGQQGRVASGLIRDQARAVAASTTPLAKSPAGAQLIMAAMDQHLSAMQGQLQSTKSQYQGVSATLQQVAAGYQTLSNGAKDSPPAVPLDSSNKWKPGDKHHMPYNAGKGGLGPPNFPDSPPWVDIYNRTKDPDQVPHYFVRSDEIPGYKTLPPEPLVRRRSSTSTAIPTPISSWPPTRACGCRSRLFRARKSIPRGGLVIRRRTAGTSTSRAQGYTCGTAIWCLNRIGPMARWGRRPIRRAAAKEPPNSAMFGCGRGDLLRLILVGECCAVRGGG